MGWSCTWRPRSQSPRRVLACGTFVRCASAGESLAPANGVRRTAGRGPSAQVALVLPGVGLRAPAAQPEVRAPPAVAVRKLLRRTAEDLTDEQHTLLITELTPEGHQRQAGSRCLARQGQFCRRYAIGETDDRREYRP